MGKTLTDNMKEKHFDTRTKNGKPLVNPENYQFKDITNGAFSSRERDEFFNEVYGDILYDYFVAWVSTSAEDTKQREFLYSACMSLGSIKAKMVAYETKAENIQYMNNNKESDNDETTT